MKEFCFEVNGRKYVARKYVGQKRDIVDATTGEVVPNMKDVVRDYFAGRIEISTDANVINTYSAIDLLITDLQARNAQ